MSVSLQPLLPLFERERTWHQPMVLARLVRAAGASYAKPGAHMPLASARGHRCRSVAGIHAALAGRESMGPMRRKKA
jgi:xanthine/CO dehydrogenase XdhC/CoxF family maturation factor